MTDETARMPGVYVDLDDLIALEHRGRRVSFLPRQPVHSLLSGRFASRMRGRGLNFEEIRDYRSGRRRPLDRLEGDGAAAEAACARLQRGARPAGAAGRRPAAVDVLRQPACDEVGDGGAGRGDRRLARARRRRPRRRHRVQRQRSRRDPGAAQPGDGAADPFGDRCTEPGARRRPRPRHRAVMLNTALEQAQRRALHDATVIVISDFDGADERRAR